MNAYMASLYRHHGLSEDATPEQIKAKAMELLRDQSTKLYGAEMVLNRRIDSRETEIVRIFAFSEPSFAYGMLLLQKAMEEDSNE